MDGFAAFEHAIAHFQTLFCTGEDEGEGAEEEEEEEAEEGSQRARSQLQRTASATHWRVYLLRLLRTYTEGARTSCLPWLISLCLCLHPFCGGLVCVSVFHTA